MRVFKPKYTDKRTGKIKKCQHWYIGFTDNNDIRRRLPAFTNKRATEQAAEKIGDILSSGGILSPDLQRWIENIPKKMRNSLVKFGLIDNQRVSENLGKSLSEHLTDFRNSLENTGRKAKYARQVTSRIQFIFDKCGFRVWGDIDANRVLDCLASLRGSDGIGERTFNYYLKSTKQFCKWLIKERRAIAPSPIEHLSCIKQTEKRRQRRALTLDEIHKLLDAAENGIAHHNMTGFERGLVYRLALETGLRANEIRTLTVSSFNFDGRTVTVQAGYTKNKKTSTLPLKPQTAETLRSCLSGKLPNVRAFAIPDKPSKMIKKDLAAAKIPYHTDKGTGDFHSLRHSFISSLAKVGVHPSVAQALARHSTITLTMDAYTHTLREAEVDAIKRLPDLTIRQAKKKIG